MAQFSDSSFNANLYASFRPEYPDSFYRILADALAPNDVPVNRIIDLGCGTGEATYQLLELGKEVIGSDLSEPMIATANELKVDRLNKLGISDTSRLSFIQGKAEEMVDKSESFDLITCAECLHWFKDYDSFFRLMHKLLVPGGTLAYWFYIDPVIADYTGSSGDLEEERTRKFDAAKAIYTKYVYEDPNYMGPYWEEPGRIIVKDGYKHIDSQIPNELFTSTTIQRFEPATGQSVHSPNDLAMEMTIGLNRFKDYLLTFSVFSTYKNATGDPEDVLELVIQMLEHECGWDRNNTTIKIIWKSGYTFLRK